MIYDKENMSVPPEVEGRVVCRSLGVVHKRVLRLRAALTYFLCHKSFAALRSGCFIPLNHPLSKHQLPFMPNQRMLSR